jgi:hypothetical protein
MLILPEENTKNKPKRMDRETKDYDEIFSTEMDFENMRTQ